MVEPMEKLPGIARLNWAEAKVVHCCWGPAYAPPAGAGHDLSTTDPASISMKLIGGGGEAVVSIDGRTSHRRMYQGDIMLCGPEPIWWLGGSASGPCEFIEITASTGLRQQVARELRVPNHADLDDVHGWSDPVIWAIAARLRSGARRTAALNDLERDTLMRRLYARVLVLRFGGRLTSRGYGGLDEFRLRRVVDFIEGHLEEPLTVNELADVAALSPFHFLRAFRRSCGLTPYRYVRARRLERARNLLTAGIEARTVARRIGYENFGHFRTAYRAHFGLGPEHHEIFDRR
jgi:AraC family transcriptional regulator